MASMAWQHRVTLLLSPTPSDNLPHTSSYPPSHKYPSHLHSSTPPFTGVVSALLFTRCVGLLVGRDTRHAHR